MPNKLRLNIDLSKIQGSLWFTSPNTGEKCLVIVPSRSRMKHYPTKKEGAKDSLYGTLEVVPFKSGPNDREDTHFVVEPTTKDERDSGNPPQFPILGNAREYEPFATAQPAAASTKRNPSIPASSHEQREKPEGWDAEEGDEIPF
jgi:hypothetical protein